MLSFAWEIGQSGQKEWNSREIADIKHEKRKFCFAEYKYGYTSNISNSLY